MKIVLASATALALLAGPAFADGGDNTVRQSVYEVVNSQNVQTPAPTARSVGVTSNQVREAAPYVRNEYNNDR